MGTKETKKHAKEKVKNDMDSDSVDSEHELSYYINDRIKLMQQVLGLIKPKKIISMAPDSMKDMQPSAMKSLLLEELLGISNKRLLSILAGENFDDDTSSDSQIDKDEAAEVISLDDITDGSEIYISDDNNCMEIQLSERERMELEKENPSSKKSKDKSKKNKEVVVKNENAKKRKKHKKKSSIKEEKIDGDNNDEPVVNVLNLLELQARARAIRSQLASEILSNLDAANATKDKSLIDTNNIKKSKSDGEDSDSDSVICVSPQNVPVVMIQSNSEAEDHDNPKCNPVKVDNEKKTTNTEEESSNESKKKAENDLERNINEEIASPININSNDEDYNNDVLIVTEDDITLDKDTITNPKENSEQLGDNAKDDPCTWKARWLESKKVKDVMKTTKLYNSLRQKRKQKRTDSEEHDTDTSKTNEESKEDTANPKVDEEISEPSKITEETNSSEDKNLPIPEKPEIENANI